MSSPVRQRGFLLSLAAEGMGPLIRGCAAGPIGQGNEHAINDFGPGIVERWRAWLSDQPLGLRHAAITELADLPAGKARGESVSAVDRLASDASIEDQTLAVEYLCALPRSCQSSLVLDATSGARVLPANLSPEDPDVLLRLLPVDVPPYSPGSQLPGCMLGEVISTLSGVVYRAMRDGRPVTVYFPPRHSLVDRLRKERPVLEQFRDLASDRLIRLLDFDLDHATPFFVFEAVSGGDLATFLTNFREQAHRGFAPEEVSRLVEQIAEGLAVVHQSGLVHGDLKPSNVVVSGESVMLADLGIGIAVAEDTLASPAEESPAKRVRLLRGADSLLSLSPERKAGEPADPRDDLYSLGVLWYQLRTGDLTRPPAIDLVEGPTIPQRDLLVRCLGKREDRPRDASAFLAELRPDAARVLSGEAHAASVVSPEEIRRERQRKRELLQGLKEVRARLEHWRNQRRQARRLSRVDIWLALPVAAIVYLAVFLPSKEWLLANLVGLSAGMLFLLRRFQGRQKAARSARQALDHEIELLASQSPDDVHSWGGMHALHNAELLPEIIAALEEDMRALAIQEVEERNE